MADAKQLAGSLAGMSPEQALQTSQMNVSALQMQQQMQQQQQQFDTQTKLKMIGEAISQRFQQRKMQLESRRIDAYERMAKAQELNADAAYRKAQQEYQDLEQQKRYADLISGREFNTQWGAMKGTEVMALEKMGIPVKVQEADKVIDTFERELEDGSTEIRALVVRDGALQTTDTFEDLAGYKKMPEKETQIQLSPGERAEEVAKGTLKGKVTGQEWANDFYESLFATDTEMWGRLNDPDPTVSGQAKAVARQKAAKELSSHVGGNQVVFGEYDGRIGFWYEDDNGNVKFLRGDI